MCDNIDIITKSSNAKITRTFVSEITKCGTSLYDILDAEPKFKVVINHSFVV